MLVGGEGEEVPAVAPSVQERADGDGEDGDNDNVATVVAKALS